MKHKYFDQFSLFITIQKMLKDNKYNDGMYTIYALYIYV